MLVSSRKQALELLELGTDASGEDIEARFKDLAKRVHSDRGGDDEKFAELIAARDLLREEIGTDLVTQGRVPNSIDVRRAQELDLYRRERDEETRAQEASERVTQSLVRTETTRLANSKRKAALFAWLGGGIAALILVLRSAFGHEVSAYSDGIIAVVVGVLIIGAAICAVAAFFIHGQIATEEQAIEDAAEAMSDRSTFVDLFIEIIEGSDEPNADSWGADELKEAIHGWSLRNSKIRTWRLVQRGEPYQSNRLRRIMSRIVWSIRSIGGQLDPNPAVAELALLIGPAGFYRLLIAKGDETKLLEPEEWVDDSRIHIDYRLRIGPTRDRPRD
jgi:hypothetical protein